MSWKRLSTQMGLTPYANRRARVLSLGNAQRLGLAKALIHHPDLLLLDEPANGLDPAGIVEVRNLLRGLAENNGVTIFISSHILSEVARLATRIGVVHEGQLVKELDTKELAEEEEQRLVVDVRDIGAALAALGKAGITARSKVRIHWLLLINRRCRTREKSPHCWSRPVVRLPDWWLNRKTSNLISWGWSGRRRENNNEYNIE